MNIDRLKRIQRHKLSVAGGLCLVLLLSILGYVSIGDYSMVPTADGQTATNAAGTPTTQPQGPVADGAVPVKLADGFKFTEGCVSNEAGDIFFVDQDNNRIMEWTADGKLVEWLKPSGYSNGMCFDSKGNLISCADERNELWSIAPDKSHTVLIKDYQGKFLNGPNDVWIRPDGGMYITDPLYARRWWTHRTPAIQQAGQYVFYLSPDYKTLTPVVTDMRQPNGIIGTPDGKTLYASDIAGGRTFSYAINPDGSLSDKKLFCNTGSDGMTIDSDGNIYTTGRTLQIFDKTGKEVYRATPNLYCANVCIGGKDGHMLFICSRQQVYGLQLKTHRVGPQ